MFSSTHFDIRLSLQSSQVYKKPSNWNGEQFNVNKGFIAWKSAFNKKLLAARLKSYEIHLPAWQFCSPQAIAYQKQFWRDKKQNPKFNSCDSGMQGDLVNFGDSYISAASRVKKS